MSEFSSHRKKDVMSRILDVRYADVQEEARLCTELLAWAEKARDNDALAFAYTYLGDYHIAQDDSSPALDCLNRALRLLKESDSEHLELTLRVYSLLAICYDIEDDEQSATQYYLEAIALARRIGDATAECIALNNLAYALHRRRCYETARDCYAVAYRLYLGTDNMSDHLPGLLCNLVDLLLILGQVEDAGRRMEECERLIEGRENQAHFRARMRCCYHAALGEADTARTWADWALAHTECFAKERMTAFENYSAFCMSMLQIGDDGRSAGFLTLMEESCSGRLDQLKPMEELRMEHLLRFRPELEHAQAYLEHYHRSVDLKKLANQAVVTAMKSKITLSQALQQQSDLQAEQEDLTRQANLDELTQIYNRRYLDVLSREYAASAPKQLAAIMVDVDYFKEFNDFYGHIKGDDILRAIASCLRDNCPPGLLPFRYGGDEFACLGADVDAGRVEAYIRAVRAELDALAIPHARSSCAPTVTLSIGYAVSEPDCAQTPPVLFRLADHALYEAKRSGRNTFVRKRAGAE